MTVETLEPALAWDAGGITRVPYRVYEDPEVYAREQARIFRGPAWQFLGFAAELAKPGDYFTTQLGDTPIIVVRDYDGAINAMVNRCPHKGGSLCEGKLTGLVQSPEPGVYRYSRGGEILRCPWHGWEFDIRTGKSRCDPERVKARSFPVTVEAGGELAEGPYKVETFAVSIEQDYIVLTI